MKLVIWVCQKFSKPWDPSIDVEDIIQEGYVGLWKACLTFDESKGYKFATYAVACIRSQIFQMFRKLGALKLPQVFRDIRAELAKHGFALPLDPVEADTLLSEGKFSRAQLAEFTNFSVVSLDYQIEGKDDSSATIADLVEDKSARIEYQFSDEEIEQIIYKILMYIKPKHRDLVEEWMYATLEGSGVYQETLAQKYKISQPTVARVLKSAIYLVQQHSEDIRNLFGI